MNEARAEASESPPLAKIPSLPDSEVAAATGESTDGDAAHNEVASLTSGLSRKQLEEQSFAAEHGRSEKFRNHFEKLAIFALWTSALAIASIALVWLIHMVVPPDYRWLSNEDLSHIQSIVTAGLLVGVIGNHFRKRLG